MALSMPADIQGLIIHRTESGLTGDEVKIAEAKNGLGYHYFVAPTGVIYQLYPDSDTLWHACKWSHVALGIAVFGDFHPPDGSKNSTLRPEQWLALVDLCRKLAFKYGPLFIMGHTDLAESTKVPGKVCPGANLDLKKLRATVYGGNTNIVQNTS